MSRVDDGYIQTFTGRMVSPLDLKPEDVCVADIAHHLAVMPRFGGATKVFYGVGQHSVLVSCFCDLEWALEGLFHDAEEAYMLDMPHPIKHSPLFEAYRQKGEENRHIILGALGLRTEHHPSIKDADDCICQTEARDLMPPLPEDWAYRRDVRQAYDFEIVPWSPQLAEAQFLSRYQNLCKRLDKPVHV